MCVCTYVYLAACLWALTFPKQQFPIAGGLDGQPGTARLIHHPKFRISPVRRRFILVGSGADGRGQNHLYTQQDRHTTNQRKAACDVTSLESPKALPMQDTRPRLARMVRHRSQMWSELWIMSELWVCLCRATLCLLMSKKTSATCTWTSL